VIQKSISKVNEDGLDPTNIAFLHRYLVIGLFLILFIDIVGDFIKIPSYYLFFIYKYLKTIYLDKTKIVIYISLSVILGVEVIFTTNYFYVFFQSFEVFKMLIASIPLLHYIPITVKSYHKQILRKLVDDSITKTGLN
jgi:hypothetical protein